jgi:hypothetical protein
VRISKFAVTLLQSTVRSRDHWCRAARPACGNGWPLPDSAHRPQLCACWLLRGAAAMPAGGRSSHAGRGAHVSGGGHGGRQVDRDMLQRLLQEAGQGGR